MLGEADGYVQSLNSRFTDPSGHSKPRRGKRGDSQGKPAASRIAGTPAPGRSNTPPAQIADQSPSEVAVIKPPADFVPEEDTEAGPGKSASVAVGDRQDGQNLS